MWSRNVTITTGLVDTFTIPRLMRLVQQRRLDPTVLATDLVYYRPDVG